ncbi:MAG TPA: hypothetical protein VIM84_08220 [Gemmatimonadales bacterium]
MNWKLGLTRVYYVLWVLWALAWIYWSALNLVHYGRSYGPTPAAAAANGFVQPSGPDRGQITPRSFAKGLIGGSVILESSGEARWYFMPRPSTGQLLMLSMIGAAFPGALFLAGRWILNGFRRPAT